MLEHLILSVIELSIVLVIFFLAVKLHYETKNLQKEVQKLNEKIDLIEKIEKIVSNIQVKKEDDKDKIKQFLVKRFGNNESAWWIYHISTSYGKRN